MNLFLQGQFGIGKSSLLRKALEPYSLSITGLVTQRLLKNSKTIGYRAIRINGALPPLETIYTPGCQGMFIHISNRQFDISVLEKTILQVEQDAQNPDCKLILLDEIGGVELKSEVFADSLLRIINGGKPCIGVLKSAPNLSHAMSQLSLDQEYLSLHNRLEQMIRRKGELIPVTFENREDLPEYLRRSLSGF
ncbi:MAG: nucleoside-triphosphatase [Clostridiales bacterium]|nr:nucleoside-triphosphatase [Clostridiales bacterium]